MINRDANETRRRLLQVAGGAACVVPLLGLAGCSSKEPAPAAAPTAPAPAATPAAAPAAEAAPAAAEPAPAAAPAAAPAPAPAPAAGELPRLEESNTLAQALGYRHDGAQVDTKRFPRYTAGMACRNCIQFKGSASDAWGPCGIFPGKLVNAGGWCNTYLKKA